MTCGAVRRARCGGLRAALWQARRGVLMADSRAHVPPPRRVRLLPPCAVSRCEEQGTSAAPSETQTAYAQRVQRCEGTLVALDVLHAHWAVRRATDVNRSDTIAALFASCLDSTESGVAHKHGRPAVTDAAAASLSDIDERVVAWLVPRCLATWAASTGSAACSMDELLCVLGYAVRCAGVREVQVQMLVRRLLDCCRVLERHVGAAMLLERGVARVLRVAVPTQLAITVLALTELVDAVRQDTAHAHGIARVWRREVTPGLVRSCLRYVAGALNSSAPHAQNGHVTATSIQALLHECVLCALPVCDAAACAGGVAESGGARAWSHTSGAAPRSARLMREELAKVSIYAIQHAPCILLCRLMAYYEAERLASPRLRNNFLARCGSTVNHLTQTGLYLDAAARATLERNMTCLLTHTDNAGGDVEQGLVHGCVLWHALGRYAAVREIYRAHPTLRETAFSVSAWVRQGDVAGALRALRTLALSRSTGWPRVSPAMLEAMMDTSRLVGAHGTEADVAELYRTLVAFQNPGLLISHLLSGVVAGLSDRVAHLAAELGPLPPRRALEHVLPPLRAVLRYIGDDFNADVVLDLLDVALRQEHLAVPLVAGIVWTLQQGRGLAVRDLFRPSESAAVTFVQYYVLCNARTAYRRDGVLDHLLVVWQLERDVVWRRRATELVPPYKLWRCACCGRANSDRFSYCACSAQQNSHVRCGGCGYAQDERLSRCRSCGRAMAVQHVSGAVLRTAWTCTACHTTNPARQTLLCQHCRKPTGPLFASTPARRFCDCPTSGDAYTLQIGYCHRCGGFRDRHAAEESAVWRCTGCQQLRSTLERVCPRCPQVECLPAAMVGPVRAARYCWECRRPVQNAFATACVHCGAAEDALHPTPPPAPSPIATVEVVACATLDSASVSPLLCARCGTLTTTTGQTSTCAVCAAELSVDAVPRRAQSVPGAVVCTACGRVCTETTLLLSLVCPHCGHDMGAPWAEPGQLRALQAMSILHTCDAYMRCLAHAPPTAPCMTPHTEHALHTLLAAVVAAKENDAAGAPNDVTLEVTWLGVQVRQCVDRLPRGVELHARLSCLPARRGAALVKRLLDALVRFCGVAQSVYEPEERCVHCLGGHPSSTCAAAAPFTSSETLNQVTRWRCELCGAEGRNVGLGRYVCTSCLTLRDAVQRLMPAECWRCARCGGANAEFETYCVECGAAAPTGAARVAQSFPFLPAKCPRCGGVFLDPHCPVCATATKESVAASPVAVVESRGVSDAPRQEPPSPPLAHAPIAHADRDGVKAMPVAQAPHRVPEHDPVRVSQ